MKSPQPQQQPVTLHFSDADEVQHGKQVMLAAIRGISTSDSTYGTDMRLIYQLAQWLEELDGIRPQAGE